MPRLVTQDPAILRRYDLEDTLARLAVRRREIGVQIATYEHLRKRDPYYYRLVRVQHARRTAEVANLTVQIDKVKAQLAALDAAPGSAHA